MFLFKSLLPGVSFAKFGLFLLLTVSYARGVLISVNFAKVVKTK